MNLTNSWKESRAEGSAAEGFLPVTIAGSLKLPLRASSTTPATTTATRRANRVPSSSPKGTAGGGAASFGPKSVGAAERLLNLGDGVRVGAATFHSRIKPAILKAAGKFSGKVGKNPDILEERRDDPPTPFLDVFFGLLDGHFAALERIGVSRDDITVWLLYEYDEQCNLEFSAADMKRLGDAGISLCISCWQVPK